MYMLARLFTREEKKAERPLAEHCRAHTERLLQTNNSNNDPRRVALTTPDSLDFLTKVAFPLSAFASPCRFSLLGLAFAVCRRAWSQPAVAARLSI